MKDSSNNAVILIILAVVLSAVFTVMHFTRPSSTSVQLLSGTKGGSSKGINLNASDGADMYSDNLSGYKARSNSGSDGATTSGINLPTSMTAPAATIAQTDVQTVPQKQVARTSASAASIYTQTQSKTFKTANVDNQALQQNVPKSDINATIKARTAEVAPKTTKKGSVPTDKKGPQKSGEKPANPGLDGSLPIGDGTCVLLLMMGMYVTRKMMNKSFIHTWIKTHKCKIIHAIHGLKNMNTISFMHPWIKKYEYNIIHAIHGLKSMATKTVLPSIN